MIVGNTRKTNATEVDVDTTNFHGNLLSSDNTVQKCMDRVDDLIISTNEVANIDGGDASTEFFVSAIASIKSVFAWNADNVIHITVFNKLKDDKIISPKTDFQDYKEVFCGVAGIHSGKLLYISSDELDYYIKNYPKPQEQWPYAATEDYENLYNNSLTMMKNHSFVSRYIKGLEGDSNPFFQINQILHNLPRPTK